MRLERRGARLLIACYRVRHLVRACRQALPKTLEKRHNVSQWEGTSGLVGA
jgi:hypothetical protein